MIDLKPSLCKEFMKENELNVKNKKKGAKSSGRIKLKIEICLFPANRFMASSRNTLTKIEIIFEITYVDKTGKISWVASRP